ncbi:protein kinase domain-containing protein [Leptolyngbya sp. GGD]|uniref:protein kinase domain-containing protein n=1 Tax=Leptolyngbya sp. GGD TaxID=2997907 RepID=UPI00227B9FF3|nr:IMS domain-containing protein [Leptolyngbya sp. GGD]MCY6494261.1 IMS domain-containing protein [Leptolyngbya sp. GGD]
MTNLNGTASSASLLNNRYHVLDVLGDGGFGKTYLVKDVHMPSERKCVLKQLKPVSDNPEIYQMVRERFQREAAILEKLGENYDQIPRLYAHFSEADHFYLVEEWIDGETLTQRVQREGVLGEGVVREILCGLLPAIAHIHQQQIVHRDLKPDNIILRSSDRKPVLIDFGAVKETMHTIINSQGNSSHSMVVGTPGYMPSEQLAGRPVYASDLYSLGMTAIYLLTGKIPQELTTNPHTGEILWHQYAPNASPGFVAVLNRAIHMNPQARFASAQEMLTAVLTLVSSGVLPPLGSLQTNTVISAPQVSTGSQNTQFSPPVPSQVYPPIAKDNTQGWMIALGTGMLMTLVGIFVVVLLRSNGETQSKGSSATSATTAASSQSAPQASPSAPPAAPSPPSALAVSPTPAVVASAPPAPVPPVSSTPASVTSSFTASDAKVLVENWLSAKRQIFAPPFSSQAAAAVTTGSLYWDITKPGGSIDWLKNNGSYYRFGVQRVDAVRDFSVSGNVASVQAQVTEERVFYVNGRVDGSETDFKTKTTRYIFENVNGVWKVADYK